MDSMMEAMREGKRRVTTTKGMAAIGKTVMRMRDYSKCGLSGGEPSTGVVR